MAISKNVILCAGHGAGDPGAVARQTTEALQNIDIVNKLATKLRNDGQLKVYVVPHDLALQGGINWVNQRFKNVDDAICIEIHKNSCGGCGASGVETWAGATSGSQTLGKILHAPLPKGFDMRDRGVKNHMDRFKNGMAWIRETNVWAFLVECGFIETDHFNNKQYADALFKGVLGLWDLKPKPVEKPEKPFYRVFHKNVQVGAYTVPKNAWQKYISYNEPKHIEDNNGHDVTQDFIEQFGKPLPPPDYVSDVEHLKERVTRLEKLVAKIMEVLNGIKKAINF